MGMIATDITQVYDDAKSIELGAVYTAPNGKEYIFLKGVASTVAYDLVTFVLNDYTTARAVANAKGRVGVAQAAIVADKYGWYQVKGLGTVKSATVAAGAPCYLCATTGAVDDAVVAGDLIANMFTSTADSGGFCTAMMTNPFVTDTLS